MIYTYRPATRHDGTACAEIVLAWNSATNWLGPLNDFEDLVQWWSGCLHHVETSWVCEKKGVVVGFCVRQDDNLMCLYVSHEDRNHGVGKALFDLAKADREWITVWSYEKNVRARKFYRREGCAEVYREVEEGTGLIDVEHRWMRSG